MSDHNPPSPTGRQIAPDEVWAAVRADYIDGLSAAECSRRHGVGRSSLHERAGREGWRRQDQPWTPPSRLDPWDEGAELEERIGGDLDRAEFCELSYVALRRMMRAVMRGDAVEALRWRRVNIVMDEMEAETRRMGEEDEAIAWRLNDARETGGDPDTSDTSDTSDCVFESGAASPDRPEQAGKGDADD